jgi:predicted extracellular nuclease
VHCESDYGFVNIDPLENAEGGKPGGNIRVAFIYKKDKIGFQLRPLPNPRLDTVVRSNGNLNYNPGRIYPNHPAFAGSRRSVIAQFDYKGEKIYFIGNHFNSKLGDSSPWHNDQPVVFRSERRRIPMAEVIRMYVQRILMSEPNANVFVVGDFNAFMEEASMQVLKGKVLTSLTEALLPMSDRYTTNHDGNSQSLDYIFVNRAMMKKCPEARVIHMNSDFMGRIADHDPVVARFCL